MLKLINYIDAWELSIYFPEREAVLVIGQFKTEKEALKWIDSRSINPEKLPLYTIRRKKEKE